MKRKIFALLLCMVFICTLSLPVYADSTDASSDGYSVLISDIPTTCPTCGGSLSASWASTSGAEVEVQISESGSIKIPAGAGSFARVKLRCKSCGYEKSETRLLGLDFGNEKPGNLHVEQAPSGIGRKDLPGYQRSDNNPGVPSISQDGNIALLAKYRFTNNQKQLVDSFSKQVGNDIWNFGENSLYIERYSNSQTYCYTYGGYILDTNNIPGIYYIPAGTSYVFNPWGDSYKRNLNKRQWPEIVSKSIASVSSDGTKRYICIYKYNADWSSQGYPDMSLSVGDGTDYIFRQDSGYTISTSGNITIPYPKDLVVYLRPTSTNIVKNTNITINNNNYSQTWNGNIYTSDFWETNASPSYLQIEIPDPESYYIDGYIMRISKFNNRYAKDWTLQGSDDGNTWDDLDKQTGQNLSDLEEHKYPLTLRKAYKYYRLNMANYASSMCSLSHFNLLGYDAKDVVTPTPSPGTPDVTPTPVPTDKPDGGNTTNNFWNIIFPNFSDDGTDSGHKGIFWALVSLILAIIAFFTNMLAGYKYLFPFLPDGVVMTINACVFVLFLFVVIKFIMRSK